MVEEYESLFHDSQDLEAEWDHFSIKKRKKDEDDESGSDEDPNLNLSPSHEPMLPRNRV